MSAPSQPLQSESIVEAGWVCPTGTRTLITTRLGGLSVAPYDDGRVNQHNRQHNHHHERRHSNDQGPGGGLNLGMHCGDDPHVVQHNRRLVQQHAGRPAFWLDQQHGINVADADAVQPTIYPMPVADAAVATRRDLALVILTADCLPVLFSDGNVIGAAHAGWRGLAAGVLGATITAMCRAGADRERIHAWLGPAIGPDAFEVGDDVRAAFASGSGRSSGSTRHFAAHKIRPGKWFADLYGLATDSLYAERIGSVSGGGYCTVRDAERFYSYRRDGKTGRMASLIWLV